jgi:hypothetical protein
MKMAAEENENEILKYVQCLPGKELVHNYASKAAISDIPKRKDNKFNAYLAIL